MTYDIFSGGSQKSISGREVICGRRTPTFSDGVLRRRGGGRASVHFRSATDFINRFIGVRKILLGKKLIKTKTHEQQQLKKQQKQTNTFFFLN